MPTPPTHSITLEGATAFFASHPATASLLEGHTLSLPDSIRRKGSGEDNLFAVTLPHEQRLQQCLVLTPKNVSPPTSTIILMALGEELAGHPGILHGGVTATVLDEAAGILLSLDAAARGERLKFFTARLETFYRAPITTPGVVAVEMAIVEREERSIKLRGSIRQGGREVARAETDFRRPREKI